MKTKFENLTQKDFDYIKQVYTESANKKEAQRKLSEKYGVVRRTIRRWAKQLEIGVMKHNITNPSKVLIYDIETSRVPAMVWWTGKQYVRHDQLKDEPRIITVAYKWLGDDEVFTLQWDDGDDRRLLEDFLNVYNKADMVIGQNNDNFDNRWINARAMKYNLDINTFIRSFDIMKETKRLFRLPSYSMDYITKFLGVEQKMKHEGIIMWDKIQNGTEEEKKEYLEKMIEYNRQDVIATEDMYLTLRKYMGHKIHFGVLNGEEKYTCPNCGSSDISVYKTTVTPMGTVQRIMKCNSDNVKYKITNRSYMKYLEFKMKPIN